MKPYIFGLLACLCACTPPASPPLLPAPSASSSLTPIVVVSPSPGPVLSPAPNASLSPRPESSSEPSLEPSTPTSSASAARAVSRLELNLSRQYLQYKGDITSLTVSAFDAQGQRLDPKELALTYRSSRPQDFSLDQQGRVAALVDWGSSELSVSLADGSLQVTKLIEVRASSGGSGGGGGSVQPGAEPADPTRENVSGQVTFQFPR